MGTTKKSRTQIAKELVGPAMVEFFQSKDPSSSNKYVLWMSQQYKAGHDKDEIVRITNAFARRQKKLTHQDIFQYEDLRDIDLEIQKLPASKKERKELASLREGVDYVTLIDKNKIRFYYVMTFKGMKSLGYGTRWCIQAQEYHWNSYSRRNNIFVFINDRLPKSNSKHRIAILNPNSTIYYDSMINGWDQNDQQFQWHRDIGGDVGIDLINKMNLVNAVKGQPTNNHSGFENKIITYDGTKEINFYENIAAQDVLDAGLLWLMPHSHNKTILNKLKSEMLKKMGRADGSMPFSTTFSRTYLDLFPKYIESTIIDAFKTENVLGQVNPSHVKIFKQALKKRPRNEIKQLMNETSYVATRKMLLETYPDIWRALHTKHVTAGMATWLLKKFGIKTLVKSYKHFGKAPANSGGGWGRPQKENPFTRQIKKMKVPQNVIRALRKKKDLPAKLSNYLDTIERKELKPAEVKALKKAMTIVAKASQKKIKDLTYRDFNFYYQKATNLKT